MIVELNESQKLAVEHYQGPCMVIAPPGSGKTYVITRRVSNLIEEWGVDPMSILVITYTKAAAMEMQQRFYQLNQKEYATSVTFGTFHSVFFQILQHTYRLNSGNIIHEYEKQDYIKKIYEELSTDMQEDFLFTPDFLEILKSEISNVKNNGYNSENYAIKTMDSKLFWNIYRKYNALLKSNRKIDFDDMILMTYQLLKNDNETRQFWQTRFEYFLIDEMQDANTLQLEVIRMLSKNSNVFAVGDDDQSVYGFRGANPEIMLKFEEYFPDVVKIQLSTNYRSNEDIVELAGKSISNNKLRFQKHVITQKCGRDSIELNEFETIEKEMKYIADCIKKDAKETNFKSTGILFRTNKELEEYALFFQKEGITFYSRENIRNLFRMQPAVDLISYLDFAADSSKRDLFLQIMNKPNRFISRSFFPQQFSLRTLKERYFDKPGILNHIFKLEFDLKKIAGMEPYLAIHYIRKIVGYEEYMVDLAGKESEKNSLGNDRSRNGINGNDISGNDISGNDCFEKNRKELEELLDRIQETSKGYQTLKQWKSFISNYEETLLKASNKQNHQGVKNAGNETGIFLSTMHGAKGLEYDRVFLPFLNEGIIPHKKAKLFKEIEEERRIFYVALTRARTKLYLSHVSGTKENPQKPSGFWGEIIKDKKIDSSYSSSSSTSSSNSAVSRYSSNASATNSYSASSSINSNVGSASGLDSSSK